MKSIHRGSYLSAHVLLNLLNELGKKEIVRNEFNKFNNIRFYCMASFHSQTRRHMIKIGKQILLFQGFANYQRIYQNASRLLAGYFNSCVFVVLGQKESYLVV